MDADYVASLSLAIGQQHSLQQLLPIDRRAQVRHALLLHEQAVRRLLRAMLHRCRRAPRARSLPAHRRRDWKARPGDARGRRRRLLVGYAHARYLLARRRCVRASVAASLNATQHSLGHSFVGCTICEEAFNEGDKFVSMPPCRGASVASRASENMLAHTDMPTLVRHRV